MAAGRRLTEAVLMTMVIFGDEQAWLERRPGLVQPAGSSWPANRGRYLA